jgi:hypothetical protein
MTSGLRSSSAALKLRISSAAKDADGSRAKSESFDPQVSEAGFPQELLVALRGAFGVLVGCASISGLKSDADQPVRRHGRA